MAIDDSSWKAFCARGEAHAERITRSSGVGGSGSLLDGVTAGGEGGGENPVPCVVHQPRVKKQCGEKR